MLTILRGPSPKHQALDDNDVEMIDVDGPAPLYVDSYVLQPSTAATLQLKGNTRMGHERPERPYSSHVSASWEVPAQDSYQPESSLSTSLKKVLFVVDGPNVAHRFVRCCQTNQRERKVGRIQRV